MRPAGAGIAGIDAVEAACERTGTGRLRLTWRIRGALGRLRLPEPRTGADREDGLWWHTCLEAFIVPEPERAGYVEVNLAPSLAWQTYAFDDYRAGQRIASAHPLVDLAARRERDALQVTAVLRLEAAAGARVALAAVLEDVDGALSYWALAHAPGRPDFHWRGGFVLQLPD